MVTFSECKIACDYHFETAINIPKTHFNRTGTLSFFSMTIDHFPPALNSINETLDVEVVSSCNVHVIRLPMKLRNSDNCNQIKSHIRLLINAPKNMTMFRNIVQVIKRKWHIMGEKSYSDHMSKCYFVKE